MNPQDMLARLLIGLFGSAAELRRWLRAGPQGTQLLAEIPEPVSLAQAVDVASGFLGRWGLLNEAFFKRLVEHAPAHRDAILQCSVAWLAQQDVLDLAGRSPPVADGAGFRDAQGRSLRDQRQRKKVLEQIIQPLAEWSARTAPQIETWQPNPIWPIQLSTESILVRQAPITQPHAASLRWRLATDRLPQTHQHPLWLHAMEDVFPHALSPREHLLRALKDLVERTKTGIDTIKAGLDEPFNALKIPNSSRLPIALHLFELSWGYPEGIISQKGQRLIFRNVRIYDGPQAKDVLEFLKLYRLLLVGRGVPEDVQAARDEVQKYHRVFAQSLWYPNQIGLDAPPPAEQLP